MDDSLPIFPLGSVLFPYMPLQLRLFEERYLIMLSQVLEEEPAEFGVVLIERGQEVGGGEQRFAYGTIAEIAQLEAPEGYVELVAVGTRRFVVDEWMPDNPFPVARVSLFPALEWDDGLLSLRDEAESTVRRVLAMAAEFGEQEWPADLELSADHRAASWQLAGIAPVGPLDQLALLRSTSMRGLLTSVIELTRDVEETYRTVWPDGGLADGGPGDGSP
ncbi:LON peptidase substrate-binding domain-containing protein [Subtercola sp. Z020]|uniref:LON peptidase substrate-binding domain-containing protein n=1 Tax=Subtercola sp. Z020 TaxID=2080582 RepID=UPI001E551E20|nr:LON peptidase substrate-binding domain-containing protein [Subtercola sp. Z020]